MKPRPLSEIPAKFHGEIMAQLTAPFVAQRANPSFQVGCHGFTPHSPKGSPVSAAPRPVQSRDSAPLTTARAAITWHRLPYPPSANNYWRSIVINGRGRVVVSREAKAFKKAVSAALAGVSPISGPVSLTATFYRPRKRGDLDNLLKVTCDALKGIAYHDDEQIEQITAYRKEDKANPRVELSIAQL